MMSLYQVVYGITQAGCRVPRHPGTKTFTGHSYCYSMLSWPYVDYMMSPYQVVIIRVPRHPGTKTFTGHSHCCTRPLTLLMLIWWCWFLWQITHSVPPSFLPPPTRRQNTCAMLTGISKTLVMVYFPHHATLHKCDWIIHRKKDT